MSQWWKGWNRAQQESELDRELTFHLEERMADLRARGLPPDAARRQARMELRGVEQVREECREARPTRWLERLATDARYALRGMMQRPAAATTFVLTVALCVGVNTAVFTVVDSLLLRPLPFDGADRLITMTNQYPKAGIGEQNNAAGGDLTDRQGKLPAVAEHALFRWVTHPLEWAAQSAPQQVDGVAVTSSFFSLLRVRPAQGRLFTASDCEPGKDLVVLLTESLRRQMFGAAGGVGSELRLSGKAYKVAGVLPAEFRFLQPKIRYFVPLALSASEKQSHHQNPFHYIARLRDGATVAQAQAQVDALNAQVTGQLEIKQMLVDAGFHTLVSAWQPWLMRQVRPSLTLLWAGAGLVLLIGIVNLAGLELARAGARARETATRLALGATRGDLLRQSLMETLLPSLLGAALGSTAPAGGR